METYENGGHAYHATMPTDSLANFLKVISETEEYGFNKAKTDLQILGDKVRALLRSYEFKNVAAKGYESPGVVVSYTKDSDIQTGKKFLGAGLQIAAGVPLQCDEPETFKSFRLGLFGLDKLKNIDRTVMLLEKALIEIV